MLIEPVENAASPSSVQPVLALLGFPVGGNPTQFMLEKAFAGLRLDWRYLSLDVRPEDLAAAVGGMRALGFRGGNCTGPHKRAIAGQLDRLTQHAAMVGAVNCFFRDDAGLIGDNTEGRAMLQSLRRKVDPAGKRVVLLGAGAMARAIAVELALAKAAEIVVVNRSEPAGRGLVDLIGSLQTSASLVVWQDDYAVPAETHVLVDATSIPGDQPLPLGLDVLTPGAVVADAGWEPPQTWLLDQAAQRGATTIDGLEVFIEQAAINFRQWTGAGARAGRAPRSCRGVLGTLIQSAPSRLRRSNSLFSNECSSWRPMTPTPLSQAPPPRGPSSCLPRRAVSPRWRPPWRPGRGRSISGSRPSMPAAALRISTRTSCPGRADGPRRRGPGVPDAEHRPGRAGTWAKRPASWNSPGRRGRRGAGARPGPLGPAARLSRGGVPLQHADLMTNSARRGGSRPAGGQPRRAGPRADRSPRSRRPPPSRRADRGLRPRGDVLFGLGPLPVGKLGGRPQRQPRHVHQPLPRAVEYSEGTVPMAQPPGPPATRTVPCGTCLDRSHRLGAISAGPA